MQYPRRSTDVGPNRFAKILQKYGWICFGIQLFLGLFPILLLVFLLVFRLVAEPARGTNWVETILMFLCLLTLSVSIYWSYCYTQLAKRLQHTSERPARAAVKQQLWRGVGLNLSGMAITILIAFGLAWELSITVLFRPQLATVTSGQGNVMKMGQAGVASPIEVIGMQAIVHTLAAELIGVVISLWLLRQLLKK
jgi:hypothetical protein